MMEGYVGSFENYNYIKRVKVLKIFGFFKDVLYVFFFR